MPYISAVPARFLPASAAGGSFSTAIALLAHWVHDPRQAVSAGITSQRVILLTSASISSSHFERLLEKLF